MKKLLCFLLAILLLVCCFSACDKTDGGSTDGEQKDTDSADGNNDEEITDEDMKVELSDATLDIPEDAKELCDGKTFTVFAPTPYGIPIFKTEAPNGEPVNDAVYNRNLALQDVLGVTVDCIDYGYYTHNQAEKIIDSVIAGDHGFDVAAIHTTSACASLIIADAVLPFDQLEYCDLSKPWWDQGFQESCSIAGNDLFAINSACKNYYTNVCVVLFNKDMAKDLGLPDLYELVKSDQWTVDKMIQLTKNVSRDMNNDGFYDYSDSLALISNDYSYMNAWLGAFRQYTVQRGENDEPTVVVDSSRMSLIIDKLNTLYNSGRRAYLYGMHDSAAEAEALANFARGDSLFYIGYVNLATRLREYDINFGILPLPKLDETQEKYGSWVDPWHLALCVPIDAPDPEVTSIILEALGYYSYRTVYPATVEQKIFGTGTRDVASLEMLEDYIYPNVFYDFGYIYDGYDKGYGDVIRTLIPTNSTDIASYIAEKRNKAESHYAELYDAILKNYG